MRDSGHTRKRSILKNTDLIAIITSVVVILLIDVAVMLAPIPSDLVVGSRNFSAMFSLKVTFLILGDVIIFYLVYRGATRIVKRLLG